MIAYDSGCCFRGSSAGSRVRVLWELNTVCNLRCSFCHAAPHDMKGMSLDKIKKGIGLLKKWGTTGLIFSGGEPFLRTDIFEILYTAAASGLELDICTNGTLITKDKAKSLSEILSEISVSLDTSESRIHDRLRGTNGAWNKTVEGMEMLLAGGLEIHVISLFCEDTAASMENTVRFLDSMGVHSVTFLGIMKYQGNEHGIRGAVFDTDQLRKTLEYLRNSYKIIINTKRVLHGESTVHCGAGDMIWGVDTNGFLLPCILLKRKTRALQLLSLEDAHDWNDVRKLLGSTRTDFWRQCS
jgi:MoaA/NifB/PqqE/SkfB family radical SAM enzyme